MIAVKRCFDINSSTGRKCLKCGEAIGSNNLRDDTIYTCECGQRMYVDRYGSNVTLTAVEKEYLRHRTEYAPGSLAALEKENADLKAQLEEAREAATKWKNAADGLARMIEEKESQAKG